MGAHPEWPWPLWFFGEEGRQIAARALNGSGRVHGTLGWTLGWTEDHRARIRGEWTQQPRIHLTGTRPAMTLLHQMIGVGSEPKPRRRENGRVRWTLNGAVVVPTLLRYCWADLSPEFLARLPEAVDDTCRGDPLCPYPGCPQVARPWGLCRWDRALASALGMTRPDPERSGCLACRAPAAAAEGLPRYGRLCGECSHRIHALAQQVVRLRQREYPHLEGRHALAIVNEFAWSRARRNRA